jgi:hypothetical protein
VKLGVGTPSWQLVLAAALVPRNPLIGQLLHITSSIPVFQYILNITQFSMYVRRYVVLLALRTSVISMPLKPATVIWSYTNPYTGRGGPTTTPKTKPDFEIGKFVKLRHLFFVLVSFSFSSLRYITYFVIVDSKFYCVEFDHSNFI